MKNWWKIFSKQKQKGSEVNDKKLSVNNEVDTEAERERKLQEIDEQIAVILPVINS